MRTLIAVLPLLLAACAKVVPPDGGPRDEQPPQLLQTVPANEGVNFAGSQVYLAFDEYIQLKDVYNQLIVSPPLGERPEIKIKKKGVYLQFKEALLPNVTYTLNFGQGIVDYTEGNPAEVRYVFSTGSVLDSLSLEGKVEDAFTGDALEGVRVMLFRDTSRMQPLEEKPYYLARSRADGSYRFDYLAEGEYRLVALREENNNYLYDDAQESFAFSDELVRPVAPSDSLQVGIMRLSQASDTSFFLSGFASDSSGYLRVQLTGQWAAERLLAFSDSSLNPQVHFKAPDSLFLFCDPKAGEEVFWVFETSRGRDTLYTNPGRMSRQRLGTETGLPKAVRSEDSLSIVWNRPLASFDTTKMRLLKDSLEIPFRPWINKGDFPFTLRVDADLADAANYSLLLDSGAVTSREGFVSDSLGWTFSAHPTDHYGTLLLRIELPDNLEECIVELVQGGREGQTTARKSIRGSGPVLFERLLPATYRLRLIHDRNGNGRFDPLDYLEGRQPEEVWNMNQELSVRSNWDLEVDWSIKE